MIHHVFRDLAIICWRGAVVYMLPCPNIPIELPINLCKFETKNVFSLSSNRGMNSGICLHTEKNMSYTQAANYASMYEQTAQVSHVCVYLQHICIWLSPRIS
jgi:hypothetical protein